MARPVQMLPRGMVLKACLLSRGILTSVEGHLGSATADLTAVLDCNPKLMGSQGAANTFTYAGEFDTARSVVTNTNGGEECCLSWGQKQTGCGAKCGR